MADRDGNSFLWFLAGLGVGAVVGVLYAPSSGDQIREAILNKAGESGDIARQAAQKARQQASEWVDRGSDVINQQKERVHSAYEAGRQAYNETTSATTAPPKSV